METRIGLRDLLMSDRQYHSHSLGILIEWKLLTFALGMVGFHIPTRWGY
jgi:hypothetical protein